VIGVEEWAEIRRMHRVERVAIREIRRRTGLHRETIRRALANDQPLRYRRKGTPSKLDSFKEEIERLLRSDPPIPNTRIRELICELGYEGGKTILDTHLREVRPRFAPKRTYQRTVYRPGEICQFDLWGAQGGDPGRSRANEKGLDRHL
jgi:transposase